MDIYCSAPFPGGLVSPQEDLFAALVRELCEELGRDVAYRPSAPSRLNPGPDHDPARRRRPTDPPPAPRPPAAGPAERLPDVGRHRARRPGSDPRGMGGRRGGGPASVSWPSATPSHPCRAPTRQPRCCCHRSRTTPADGADAPPAVARGSTCSSRARGLTDCGRAGAPRARMWRALREGAASRLEEGRLPRAFARAGPWGHRLPERTSWHAGRRVMPSTTKNARTRSWAPGTT
ncbi:NUDIX domain-containing protein [Kitasatospora indigofera]|uniref:NUDIX domain-containing protein n=1 Tax=Kitasatospora indigofera TaxID=67307 RepID=UPI003688466B